MSIPKALQKLGVVTATKDGGVYLPSVERVSTGIKLVDEILGGGLPKSRIIEIFGPEGGGKSTIALEICAAAQNGKNFVTYVDAENSLDITYAEKIGVDLDTFGFTQPNSAEEALDIVCASIRENSAITVIDSAAAMIPMAIMERDADKANIANRARLLSEQLPKINTLLGDSKTVVIFLNQIRMKIGVMFGNPETTPGGFALKFYASIRVRVAKGKAIKIKGKKDPVGHMVRLKTDKNKTGLPFKSCEIPLLYGEGIHSNRVDRLKKLGLVQKKRK